MYLTGNWKVTGDFQAEESEGKEARLIAMH